MAKVVTVALLSLLEGIAMAQDRPVINQGPGSALSFGQSGGITAGTVNIVASTPRLAFSNQLAIELLAGMPVKKKVLLHTIGNDTDQQVGIKIQNFLSKSGYPIERTIIGMKMPPPNGKVTLSEPGDHYLLTVAPSAQ